MTDCTVSVIGESSVSEQPDQATINFSVISRHDDQKRVVSELNERSEIVLESLESSFGFTDSVESTGFNVNDARSRARDESPDYNYVGNHSFSVTVDDLSNVGSVIDTVMSNGASQVGRVDFGLSESTYEDCRDEAIELAVQSARHEAEVASRAEELEIVGVLKMDVQRTRIDGARRTGEAMQALSVDDTQTEIKNENVSVNATVSVEYQLA